MRGGTSRRDSFLTVKKGAHLVSGLRKTGKTSDRCASMAAEGRAIPFNYRALNLKRIS